MPRFIRRLFRTPYDGLRHLGVVKENVLYRCGQPMPEQLQQLIVQYGLRTVVSLRGSRGADDPDDWERDERAVCQAHNVEFVNIPCNHKNPPTPEQVEQFLDLTRDVSKQPILVHCRLGQQRTLLFCALYRVHVEGVNAEQALTEMDELGFNIRHRRHQRLLESFRAFASV